MLQLVLTFLEALKTMHRLALALLFLPVLIFAQDFNKAEVKATKISGDVYMLQGAGGNMAALIGQEGILLVDTDYPPMAEKVRAALKSLAPDKPVRFIINTHYHTDHVGGNAAFAETPTVIAHENARKRMEHGSSSGNGGSFHFEMGPVSKAALPAIGLDSSVTIHINGEDVSVVHLPAAHTDGDEIVYFRKANVVHLGDDFVRYGFPYIDVKAGGSIKGMISAMETVLAQMPPDVKVIPGHGQMASLSDVRDYLTMLKETTVLVEQAMKAGKSLDQMKQEKLLAAWPKLSTVISADVFIETIYYSLGGATANAKAGM
jgi:cyclase